MYAGKLALALKLSLFVYPVGFLIAFRANGERINVIIRLECQGLTERLKQTCEQLLFVAQKTGLQFECLSAKNKS